MADLSTAPAPPTPAPPGPRAMPPVLGRLLRGTFWLALRTPLQAVFIFWSVPLIIRAIGQDANGAYLFAWNFGFLQFLLEFGMGSALQRQVSDAWTRGDREEVDRVVTCGAIFYAVVALIQAAVLVWVIHWALPRSKYAGTGEPYDLIVRLLWLQVATAPTYGITMLVSSVLQAARRFDVIPRFEVGVVILRFAVLLAGLRLEVGFFWIVVIQTLTTIGLSLGPAIWVMVRELDYAPRFVPIRLADFGSLTHISIYMFLIQLSVTLADRMDTIVLGYALDDSPGGPTTIYDLVSKPFLQIRQVGWMLSSLVMPAAASLLAARDDDGLERLKYDGNRLLIGLLTPVALLAWIYAGPFLAAWLRDPSYAQHAGLLRLFLVATLPLALSIPVQIAIATGRLRLIAVSSLLGALANLPLSLVLTWRIGLAGVIWGTVLTVLVSNLLVPGVYLFRELKISPATFLRRTLFAPACGATALVAATWLCRSLLSLEPLGRLSPLLVHLTVGTLAYILGYLAAPRGRADLAGLVGKLRRRLAPSAPA